MNSRTSVLSFSVHIRAQQRAEDRKITCRNDNIEEKEQPRTDMDRGKRERARMGRHHDANVMRMPRWNEEGRNEGNETKGGYEKNSLPQKHLMCTAKATLVPFFLSCSVGDNAECEYCTENTKTEKNRSDFSALEKSNICTASIKKKKTTIVVFSDNASARDKIDKTSQPKEGTNRSLVRFWSLWRHFDLCAHQKLLHKVGSWWGGEIHFSSFVCFFFQVFFNRY